MYNIKQHNIWKLCTFVTDWQNWQSSISHLHKIDFFSEVDLWFYNKVCRDHSFYRFISVYAPSWIPS